jgi:hypothetical protein
MQYGTFAVNHLTSSIIHHPSQRSKPHNGKTADICIGKSHFEIGKSRFEIGKSR